jgi:methanogenic corrinoid protein MtbC1
MSAKEAILLKLKESVINQDCEAAKEAAQEALNAGIDPIEAIQKGLYAGLKEVCDNYEKIYFVAELVIASDAFYDGMKILKTKLGQDGAKQMKKGVGVLGVVQGDIHDLGKNMVKYLFEAAGIDIIDLGFNVSAERFIEEATKVNADFILISTMLSSLFPEIGKIVKMAKEKGIEAKIMAGGGPVTEDIAMQYGADAWALTAPLAVEKALQMLKKPVIVQKSTE